MASSIPERLGAYEIVSLLGTGGMGEVYLARDIVLKRDVAIKMLPEAFASDRERLLRFEQEALTTSALNHPNILTIFGTGQSGATSYIVTEFVPGETLHQRLARGRLPLTQAIDISLQVSSALAAAHGAGIVHRDIKPANIMLRPDGYVKVLDFGVAKLTAHEHRESGTEASTLPAMTHPGHVVGTIRYMAPEQARGIKVDTRADIFSLGVVIYEMVTGTAPFEGATPADLIVGILEREPLPLDRSLSDAPSGLQRIVTTALAKNPDARYQVIQDLHRDLNHLKQDLELQARQQAHPMGSRAGPAPSTASTAAQRPGVEIPAADSKPTNSKVESFLREVRRPRLSMARFALALAATLLTLWGVRLWWQPAGHTPPAEARKWYDVGVNAMRDGAYYQASVALQRAIGLDDQFALAHARLGEAWAELDYSDRAKDELLHVARLVPDRSALPQLEGLYLAAVTATATREFAAAIESYRRLAELSPNEGKAYVYLDLGRAYEKSEAIQKAIESYAEAGKLDPQYATAYLRIGILKGRQKEPEAAEAAFKKAEGLYQALGNTEGRAEVHYQRGFSLRNAGKIPQARAELQQALDLARAAGNESQQILALLQLSSVLFAEGDIPQSQKYANEALASAQQKKMENITARGLIDLGNAVFSGDRAAAEQYYSRALDFARGSKSPRNEARALLALGGLKVIMGRPDEGLRDLEPALAFYRQGGYRVETRIALIQINRARRDKGDFQGALAGFQEQLEFALKNEDKEGIGQSHDGIASMLLRLERYPGIPEHYEQSYAAYKSLGNQLSSYYSLLNRAGALWRLGRYPEASELIRQVAAQIALGTVSKDVLSLLHAVRNEMALSQRRFSDVEAESREILALAAPTATETLLQCKRILGLARAQAGAPAAGRELCDESVEMARQMGNSFFLVKSQLSQAEAALESGDAAAALRTLLPIQEGFERAGQHDSAWRALLLAARAGRKIGDNMQARKYALQAAKILEGLETQWGKEAYQGYLSRPDIQFYRRQLNDVLKDGS